VCAADRAIEVLRADEPSEGLVDTSLLPALTESLQDLDPGATVAPMLSPGVTDGRFFARLGIRHHGLLPMQIPDPAAIIQTMHGANERVPVGALEFGTQVFQRLLLSA
jgi:acetylornithine deacetylase/succinyl-diaminopimelate desuccinylase-like protein